MLGPLVGGAGGALADGVGPRTDTEAPADCARSALVGVFFSFSPPLLALARPMFSGIMDEPTADFFALSFFRLLLLVADVSSSLEDPLLLVELWACVTRSTLTTAKFSRPRGS